MKLLIVLGSGGHTSQMLELYKLLGSDYNYEFVINKDDRLTRKKIKGRFYTMTRTRSFGESKLRQFINAIKNIKEAYKIIKKTEAQAIISSGPGITIALFLFAKIFKKNTIFIESWSRTKSKSRSGKFCYYLSDLFFVQWPELKKMYPKAIYAGRLR